MPTALLWLRADLHLHGHSPLRDAVYDVTSNWGNWAYVAGVGSAPRDRYVDVELQAEKYDPEAALIGHGLPALAGLPPGAAIAPYRMTAMEQQMHGVTIGSDYPAPALDYDRVTQRLRAGSRPGRAERGSRSDSRRRGQGRRP